MSEDPLELVRAGSGLSIDAEGRMLHRGDPITHARTLEVLWRSLSRDPDGRYRVHVGRETALVRIDDAPYAVRGLVEDPGGPPWLALSDGTRERLDPATLSVGADGVLRCTVKGGEHAARFGRSAQVALGLLLEESPAGSGRFALTLGGVRYPVHHP